VEIDEATGAVSLARYLVVDDVGTVINPVTLKGQIHGGVAQGVGQALMEQVVYDRENGSLLTTSFMEYGMPRADDFCDMHIESNPVPTKLNPLGAKGAGEAGTVGALPAVMNAVLTRWLRSECASSTCRPRVNGCGRSCRPPGQSLTESRHPEPSSRAVIQREETDRGGKLDDAALDTLLRKARTQNGWLPTPSRTPSCGPSTT